MKRFNILENRRRNLAASPSIEPVWNYMARIVNRPDGVKLANSRITLQDRRPGHPVLSQLP